MTAPEPLPEEAVTEAWQRCSIGSCNRHQMCMYLRHPRCPARAMRAATQPAALPEGGYPLSAFIWKREGEWVLEISGVINDCDFTARHSEPLSVAPEDVAGLPSLYAAMPEEEVMRRAREAAYEHAAQVADYAVERAERDWRNPDKQDAVKQVGAEIAEVIRHYALSAPLPPKPKVDEDAEPCPICDDQSIFENPARTFCDKHYRQYLATFQCHPKDLAAYRAARLEDGK